MEKLPVLLILIFCITHNTCTKTIRKKDNKMLGSDIYAELFYFGSSISKCLNIKDSKTLAVIDGSGAISVGKITNSEFSNNKNYNSNFPYPCKRYYSLKNGSLLWGFILRDFYIIDIDNNNISKTVVSANGNERIIQMDILKYDPLKLYIDIAKSTWGKSIHRGLILDPLSDSTIDTTQNYSGEIFPLSDGKIIFEKFNGTLPSLWQIGDNFKTELFTNDLTNKLNDIGVSVWADSYSYLNNFMIGFNNKQDITIFYCIKWNDNFEDVFVEPFSYQRDYNKILWNHFEISPDGKWAKTVSRQSEPYTKIDTITFFAINDSFPQSLSLPVYGGVSSRNGGGCFVETDDWGTVYIDITPEMPGHLVVYKMNDVMEKVIEKTQKLGQ